MNIIDSKGLHVGVVTGQMGVSRGRRTQSSGMLASVRNATCGCARVGRSEIVAAAIAG